MTGTASVELDGTEISASITDVTVTLAVGEVNRASITYMCHSVEIDGVFHVVHRCPESK
jgi:hypothetical protein